MQVKKVIIIYRISVITSTVPLFFCFLYRLKSTVQDDFMKLGNNEVASNFLAVTLNLWQKTKYHIVPPVTGLYS